MSASKRKRIHLEIQSEDGSGSSDGSCMDIFKDVNWEKRSCQLEDSFAESNGSPEESAQLVSCYDESSNLDWQVEDHVKTLLDPNYTLEENVLEELGEQAQFHVKTLQDADETSQVSENPNPEYSVEENVYEEVEVQVEAHLKTLQDVDESSQVSENPIQEYSLEEDVHEEVEMQVEAHLKTLNDVDETSQVSQNTNLEYSLEEVVHEEVEVQVEAHFKTLKDVDETSQLSQNTNLEYSLEEVVHEEVEVQVEAHFKTLQDIDEASQGSQDPGSRIRCQEDFLEESAHEEVEQRVDGHLQQFLETGDDDTSTSLPQTLCLNQSVEGNTIEVQHHIQELNSEDHSEGTIHDDSILNVTIDMKILTNADWFAVPFEMNEGNLLCTPSKDENQPQSFSTPIGPSASFRAFELCSPIFKEAAEEDSDSSSPMSESLNIAGVDTSSADSDAKSEDDYEAGHDLETSEVAALSKACILNTIPVHDYTSVSISEGILDLMEVYINNNDSKKGLGRAVKNLCKILPEAHHMPTSAGSILKFVKKLAPSTSATPHFYCKHCLLYHGTSKNGKCKVCERFNQSLDSTGAGEGNIEDVDNDTCAGNINAAEFQHFFFFNVTCTIKYLFECRNLASAIDLLELVKSEQGFYCDIQDGSEYKARHSKRAKYDICLILNSDGVRIRKCSPKELWLVLCSIVEVPVHLRHAFIFIVAIWYDKVKPDMRTLLKPFCEELKLLRNEGVKWKHPKTGEIHTSRVQVHVVVADAPARANMQNIMNFNGKHGCNLCEVKTVRAAPLPGKKRVRYYPYVHNPVLRSRASMQAQALRVEQEAGLEQVKGVKGPSALSTAPGLNISTCFIPEYMHSVLLGVTKQMLTMWTSLPGAWNIKSRIPTIDIFLKNIHHPDFIHRKIRALKALKYFKASDLYYFLLFESLPTLQPHLPQQYFQHFLLLVKGIYLLLQSRVHESDIDEAENLLKLFVNKFPDLYLDRLMTYNIHQLCHLPLCVRSYGPLFAASAFPFEDINGIIGRATHGTKFVEEEIVNNVKVSQGMQVLRCVVKGIVDFNKPDNDSPKFVFMGQKKDVILPEREAAMFIEKKLVFSRARIGCEVYTSEIYKCLTSQNYHVMWQQHGQFQFGTIKYFVQTQDQFLICLRLYKVDHLKVFYNIETRRSIHHFIPVVPSDDFIVVELKDIVHSLVKLGKVGDFLYKRPNLYHHKL